MKELDSNLKIGDMLYKTRVNPDGTAETHPCKVTWVDHYNKGKFYYIEQSPDRRNPRVGNKKSFEKVTCSRHGRSLMSRTPNSGKVIEKLREDALHRIEEEKRLLEMERKWLESIETAYRRQMEGISSDSCLGEESNGNE